MSEIPDDIIDAALDALKAARPAYDSEAQYDAHWESVARAILAERERCAKIARTAFGPDDGVEEFVALFE